MKALVLLLVLWLPAAWADQKKLEGQETQNGSGLAEQNIAYALTLLRPIYQMCLSDRTGLCLKSTRQRQIIFGINRDIETERKNPTLLRFLPGSDPVFKISGVTRVAVTGLRVGSEIFINQDMIYDKITSSQAVPMSVEQAISLLTHELGHHQGEVDHDLLDTLGANVRAFFEADRERIRIDTFSGRFSESKVAVNVHHWRNPFPPFEQKSTFWLTVNDTIYDVNESLARQIECPKGKSGVEMKVAGYRFHNMHWEDPVPTQAGFYVYPLNARLWLQCHDIAGGEMNFMAIPYDARVFFQFTPSWRMLEYVRGGIYVQMWPR